MVTDLELIQKIKEGDNEAFSEILARHSGIYYDSYRKFNKLENYLPDENKNFVVFKAALSFNPEKNVKFNTWLGNFTRYYCYSQNSIKDNHLTLLDNQSIIEKSDVENFVFPFAEKACEIQNIKDYLNRIKNKKIRKIINLLYFSEKKMSLEQVAKEVKTTKQYVSSVKIKFLKTLENKIGDK